MEQRTLDKKQLEALHKDRSPSSPNNLQTTVRNYNQRQKHQADLIKHIEQSQMLL